MIYDIKDIDVSSFSSNLFCVQGCIQSSNFQPKLFRNKAYFSGCFPFSGILFKSFFPFTGILFKTLHLQLKVRLVSYFSQTQTRSKPIRCAPAKPQLQWDLNSSPPQASILQAPGRFTNLSFCPLWRRTVSQRVIFLPLFVLRYIQLNHKRSALLIW